MIAAETDRARDALQSIPPDLPREDWVRAGMAAQAAGLDFNSVRFFRRRYRGT